MEGFIHSSSIMMHFSKLPDPRKARNQLYSLHDIIVTCFMQSRPLTCRSS
ncbi:transposase family protein [Candidatus Rhabdochlamydia sp. W815]|nr:transposase family protein [Candidatus Rhabdochlamydia sp. W815]